MELAQTRIFHSIEPFNRIFNFSGLDNKIIICYIFLTGFFSLLNLLEIDFGNNFGKSSFITTVKKTDLSYFEMN